VTKKTKIVTVYDYAVNKQNCCNIYNLLIDFVEKSKTCVFLGTIDKNQDILDKDKNTMTRESDFIS
jgi:hypothetical protein